jgi:hypothetical protein
MPEPPPDDDDLEDDEYVDEEDDEEEEEEDDLMRAPKKTKESVFGDGASTLTCVYSPLSPSRERLLGGGKKSARERVIEGCAIPQSLATRQDVSDREILKVAQAFSHLKRTGIR